MSADVLDTGSSGTTFNEDDNDVLEFMTQSGQAWEVSGLVGQNALGAACFANVVAIAS